MVDSPVIKEFSFYRDETPKPVSLRINGTDFPCEDEIDGLTLLGFIAALQVENPQALATGLTNFLQVTVVDYPAFEKFVKDNKIDLEQLTEIAGSLVEVYTGERPTQSPVVPLTGLSSIGDGQTATASSVG